MEWRRELAEEYSGVRPYLVLDSLLLIACAQRQQSRSAYCSPASSIVSARYHCEHKRITILFSAEIPVGNPTRRMGERITIVLIVRNVQSFTRRPYFG
jgi:hypothetical protein